MTTVVKRAIKAAGGASALARRIGTITPQAVSKWKKIPPLRVAAVSAATGIPQHELRPDLYRPPEEISHGETEKVEG